MQRSIMTFGAELRRMRVGKGLSMAEFATLIHYSKGHISKIENGVKQAQPDFAKRCDAALDANGALARLVTSQPSPVEPLTSDGEVWMLNLDTTGSWFQPIDRRQALAIGLGSALHFSLSDPTTGTTSGKDITLDLFGSLLDHLRRLGQAASPGLVLPTLIAQNHVLRQLSAEDGWRYPPAILTLAARYAEYTGWMAQESGNDHAALWWTDRAVELASAGNDRDLVGYSMVRRALVALYHDDAVQTIALAQRALAGPYSAEVHVMAARRLAQGYALAGDYEGCLRHLDEASELQASGDERPSTPPLGSSNLPDPAAVITGWCLYDLGRPSQAAEILDHEVQRLPAQALRTQARYGVRRALAHAAAGNVDHACVLTEDLLDVAHAVDSATIRTDLRRLVRILSRSHTKPAVQQLYPRLTALLHGRDLAS